MSDALPENNVTLTMRWFCACAEYPDDPGSVVCWKCGQPLVEIHGEDANDDLIRNLFGVMRRYREALGELADNKHGFRRPAGLIAKAALDGDRLPEWGD